jgi:azurin
MNRIFPTLLLTLSLSPLLLSCGPSGPDRIVIRPVGDEMRYETTEFTVQAGSQVTLVMDNVSTLPAMLHNVVILAAGADPNVVGLAALQAGEAGQYVPDNDDVLFHTGLVKPGEEREITFTAPAAGEYIFICTFPGHYTVMKGIMRVE